MSTSSDKKTLSRAEKDVLAANYAYVATKDTRNGSYADLPEGTVNTDDIMKLQEHGITFLGISDMILYDGEHKTPSDPKEKRNPALLRSVIFLNEKTKEITIAIAGTRADQGIGRLKADLRDDARLALGWIPRKMDAVQKINETLINDLKTNGIDNISEYKFHYTGHSLGAVMADCAATDMTLRLQHEHKIDVGKDQISTVTFDNPGAKTVVKNICADYKKKYPDAEIDIDKVKEVANFKAINNRPNFINTLDKQVGDKFTLVQDKPLSSFRLMCGYISDKCKILPLVGRITRLMSMGSIQSQMSSHSLTNFQNVIVQKDQSHVAQLKSRHGQKISLDEAITGFEPIQYDQKVFAQIQSIRNTGNGNTIPVKYSMVNETTNEHVVCSINQLTQAVDAVTPKPTLSPKLELNVVDTSPQKQITAKKFTDMFKSKSKDKKLTTKFHIKTADEVVSQNKTQAQSTHAK